MPNSPYLDESVHWKIRTGAFDFAEGRYRETVEGILSSGLATEVVGLISAGKEADVFLGLYRGAPLAVKVYRLYRTSHRGGRPVKLNTMGRLAANEFELMHLAWKGGSSVPTPARRVENMFSMRYLGDEGGPAPRLVDVRPADPQALLEEVLAATEALVRAGIVHGDLSAYNILAYQERTWFIDFSTALRVDRMGTSPWMRLQSAAETLTRDMNALHAYFAKWGATFDVEAFVARILEAVREARLPGGDGGDHRQVVA